MNTKCDVVMNKILELDKNEHIPLILSCHLLTCKKCRSKVRLCSLAEKLAAKPLNSSISLESSSLSSLMTKISNDYSVDKIKSFKPVSLSCWIISGIIMIATMLCFGLLTSPKDTKPLLLITFYLFFAASVSIYCALFVGSNMDFFIKKFTLSKQNHVLHVN